MLNSFATELGLHEVRDVLPFEFVRIFLLEVGGLLEHQEVAQFLFVCTEQAFDESVCLTKQRVVLPKESLPVRVLFFSFFGSAHMC